MIYLFFLVKLWLQIDKEIKGHTNLPSTGSLSRWPNQPELSWSEAGSIHFQNISSGSRVQGLGPSFADFPRPNVGSGFGSFAAMTGTSTYIGYSHYGQTMSLLSCYAGFSEEIFKSISFTLNNFNCLIFASLVWDVQPEQSVY